MESFLPIEDITDDAELARQLQLQEIMEEKSKARSITSFDRLVDVEALKAERLAELRELEYARRREYERFVRLRGLYTAVVASFLLGGELAVGLAVIGYSQTEQTTVLGVVLIGLVIVFAPTVCCFQRWIAGSEWHWDTVLWGAGTFLGSLLFFLGLSMLVHAGPSGPFGQRLAGALCVAVPAAVATGLVCDLSYHALVKASAR